ncbi:S8 family serine peptidase [Flexithrix dorotheae]|uniref:S8 family serine peptidase n=1 Tax=Flexithrix dorotheae TaxID=70993 RepID=UPI0003772447|nr:S8 family serine peptidase [Flexithrix dorotheae]
MKILSTLILYFSVIHLINAQQKYWIEFTDKDESNYKYQENLSEKAIENRKLLNLPLVQYTDIPVKNEYLKKVQGNDIQIVNTSRWLNASTAYLTQNQIEWLEKQEFVKKVSPIKTMIVPLEMEFDKSLIENPKEVQFTTAISQMEANLIMKAGLTGEGITVGVIDAGFYNADKNKFLKHLFKSKSILGARDFVNPGQLDIENLKTYSDGHGTKVLMRIAGKKGNSSYFGMATKAQFYLARSEKGDSESREEEDYWISAMEWMDSLGVRIINTSLGYAIGFDDPSQNYKPEQMNGATAMISKAAQIASDEKGILLVVSAGNEGSDPNWRIVSAPADAKGALSVGATANNGMKMGYSSIGPTSISYLKPNVSCYSMEGTSFSAPVITGFAACLMQAKPTVTNKELVEIIEKSGPLFPYGNNYIGYGVPKSSSALKLLEGEELNPSIKRKIANGKDFLNIKVDDKDVREGIVFHKTDQKSVNNQEVITGSKGRFKVTRPGENIMQSSIVIGEETFEIFW